MFIITYRKIFYSLSVLVVAASLFALFAWGLVPSIDLKGGSLLEVSYTENRPEIDVVRASIDDLSGENASVFVNPLGEYSLREAGETDYIIRMRDINPAEKDAVLSAFTLDGAFAVQEKRFNSIGPVLGKEALQKSWVSILLVLLAIVAFITFAFRKVSKPVSSWKYGLMAILSLAHNLIITAGAFALMGYVWGTEIDTLFITALLVVLGFSIHDTIVVFDRIRENLREEGVRHDEDGFASVVGKSISQTLIRSLNTSITTLIAIIALYVVGPESTQLFALALIIGITAGTYSSLFIASPLLVTWERFSARNTAMKGAQK